LPKKLDLAELFGAGVKQDERTFHKQMVNIHEFYLSGEIESPENYISWFDTIRYASENDVIKININSVGGDVFTAVQFMRVLQETSANVVISIEGLCASAATMIMLCGESFEISDHAIFMIHNYSGGVVGKGGEMLDQLQHERKWSEKMFREVYKDFLTDAEINSVLDNKDIWMDGDEVIKRLKTRQEKLDEIEKQKELEEEQKDQPKPPRKRKPRTPAAA
jgi:ATP-dependent protease ClpP protease subunit